MLLSVVISCHQKQAEGVMKAKRAFNNLYENSETGYLSYTYRPDYSLKFWKYWGSNKTAFEKFLGSYTINISKSSGTLNITVTNETSLNSFTGGWLTSYDRPRIVIPGVTDSYGTKPIPLPGASIYQNIYWSEPAK